MLFVCVVERASRVRVFVRSDVLRLARAEKECPKTLPGVGTTLTWIFDDPRGEDVLEDEMLGEFRRVRNEIELKIKAWLEHPEDEFRQLTQQRERERLERLVSER